MANISTQLADLAIVRSLLIQKVSNGLSADVAKAYQEIIDNIARDIRGANPITIKNMNATIKELKSRFEVDLSFLKPELEDLAITESAYALSAVNSTVGVDVFNKVVKESTMKNIINTQIVTSGTEGHLLDDWLKTFDAKMINSIEGVIKINV